MVYILILNYNGWKDTIECLESIFRLDYENYRVIICDNDSSDGSLDKIQAWAEGRLDVFLQHNNPLRHLSYPPVIKNISYLKHDREEGEAGGDEKITNYPLILIQTGANLGFAGGNNVGLRYALARDDFEYAWLLNNDTVVEPNTLNALIKKADRYKAATGSKVGLIGTKLMFYDQPEVIQGVGGVYNRLFAVSRHLGVFERDNGQYDFEDVISKTDYPVGASMLACKEFLEDVGLMCEDYFLYFEEMDWVLRGNLDGWQFGYCWNAKIFHKEGGTIGSNSKGAHKSELADYYSLKNRIVFTNKFYSHSLWSVRLGFIWVLLNRIRRRQFNRVSLVLKALNLNKLTSEITYER